jgi:Mg-chelatase subunit ChlD
MTRKTLFISIVLLPLIITGCGEEPQPVTKSTSQPSPPVKAAPASTPEQHETADKRGKWPFIDEEDLDGPLAEDLMARNYLLIFDGSGSMSETDCAVSSRKIDIAKQAIVAWSKSVPSNANLGLYAFHNNGVLTLPLTPGNRNEFMQTVDHIIAGGRTPLTGAMQHAYKALTDQGRRQLGYGEYTIVVVTDGIANSADDLRRAADLILAKTPITIYAIGFCIGTNHSLNQPGRTIYKSADNPVQLEKGLQEVLAELESFDELEFSE